MSNLIKNFKNLTNQKNRFNLVFFLVLLIIASFLEMMGIGLIPILLIGIQTPENILIFLNKYNLEFVFINSENLLFFIIFFSIVFFSLKNLFLFFIIYYEYKIIVSIAVYIQKKLYSFYINSSFINFSKLNPSLIQNNLISESKRIVVFLSSILKFIKEFFVSLLILITLSYISPVVVLSVILIFSLSSIFFYLIFKKILYKSSIQFTNNTKQSVKNINDFISSFREIKNYKKEFWFTQLFEKYIYKKETAQNFQNFVYQLPKLYLELLGVIIIFSLILFFTPLFEDKDDFFVFLSFFVVATLRFYPAYNVMLSSLSRIRSNILAFNNIGETIKDFDYEKFLYQQNENLEFKIFKKIQFDKINFSYDKNKQVLRDISFFISRGDKIGLIGKSGSGKSSLLDLLSGFQTPNSGCIKLDQTDLKLLNETWHQYYSYVSQETFLFDDTIKNNITFNQDENSIDLNKLQKAIEMSMLSSVIKELEFGIDTNVGHNGVNLSGGQKQRIAIARALYRTRPILLLDEATNSLDIATETSILKNIVNNNKDSTVMIITHRPESLKSCDKVYEIVDSRLKVIK